MGSGPLVEFHVGIDDTDSTQGGCTTYTASLVVDKLVDEGIQLEDFPWLVRLNPNIPWKTRGNGALAVHVRLELDLLDEAKRIVLHDVERTSDPSIPLTDPAVVFLEGTIPPELTAFSKKALHDVVRLTEARRVCSATGTEFHALGGSRGLIGALAAVGYDMAEDHTFEIVAYRTACNLGTPRKVDPASIVRMDSRFARMTFNNLDPETGRTLICPRGPDPVLFGIRGEDPASLLRAFLEVDVSEPVERVMIFKTNHGTDAHLTEERLIETLSPHMSTIVRGRVSSVPKSLKGGHVVFELDDNTGSVDCAAYEPTGNLRRVVLQLIRGDLVRAYGGIRRGPLRRLTLNLERLDVLRLVEDTRLERLPCPTCNGSTESMGAHQGLRCRECRQRFPSDFVRRVVKCREVGLGVYLPPPRSHRHLTRPFSRYWTASADLVEPAELSDAALRATREYC